MTRKYVPRAPESIRKQRATREANRAARAAVRMALLADRDALAARVRELEAGAPSAKLQSDIMQLALENEALAARVAKLEAALRATCEATAAYVANCDKDHLAECSFCRDDPAYCPNEMRRDFYAMRCAEELARAALVKP